MSKIFKQLKPGDTLFLIGSTEFIMHEDIIENFGYFKIKNIISTINGHRNPIVCLSGDYYKFTEDNKKFVSYFTALEDCEINGYQASVRIDKWSEKFTRTISEYQNLLCFYSVEDGLNFLENRFKGYIKQFTEDDEDSIPNVTLSCN